MYSRKMSEVYKKAVYCILVLCIYTNVGKAQSNIARRLEILEHKFAIQAHENELMKEELNSIKLRLSEVENCTMLVDLEIPKKSTDVKCCTENEQKTLMENTGAWQQRDQQISLLRKGFMAEKQVREESAVSLQNKMANLSTELETLKLYIKQNLEDSAILKRVTTSEKALQEITAISKGLNQTVHEDVLIKIQTMESSFDGFDGKVTNIIHLVNGSLDRINDLTQQEIYKSERNVENKMVKLNGEVKTLKLFIKQNLVDTSILNRVTTSEKALQEITDISKELNQTVHGDVLFNIQTIKSSIEGLQGEVTDSIRVVHKSLYSIKNLTQQGITKLTNYQLNQNVAFSARLTQSVPNLHPWGTLVFDQLIYNAGNGYSSQTGVFTAPRNGVYVFFTHIVGGDRYLEMCMQKNGATVLWLFVDGEIHGADSNMIVLDLQKGDRVNVVKHASEGVRPFYVHHSWSTFSGYILYPL